MEKNWFRSQTFWVASQRMKQTARYRSPDQCLGTLVLNDTHKQHHISPILASLHWLPILSPHYLSELLHPYTATRILQSADQLLLTVQKMNTRTVLSLLQLQKLERSAWFGLFYLVLLLFYLFWFAIVHLFNGYCECFFFLFITLVQSWIL